MSHKPWCVTRIIYFYSVYQKKTKLNCQLSNHKNPPATKPSQQTFGSKARHRPPKRARNDPPCRRNWAPPSSCGGEFSNVSHGVSRYKRSMGNGWESYSLVFEGQPWWLRCSKRGLVSRRYCERNERYKWSKTLFFKCGWGAKPIKASWSMENPLLLSLSIP